MNASIARAGLPLLLVVLAACPSEPVGPPAASRCAADSDCPVEAACVDGACQACAACAASERCLRGVCVSTACAEGPCHAGQACVSGRCVSPDCVDVRCPAGEACARGACFPIDCSNVACGPADVCAAGACTFTGCVGVACAAGEACADGRCVPLLCADVTCATGAGCIDGRCLPVQCVGIQCPGGTACAAGRCLPTSCGATACGAGEVCSGGRCVEALCVGMSCPSGTTCRGAGCVDDRQCRPSDAPRACGVAGSACTQACKADGTFGACVPPSGPVNVETDAANCGECGRACPRPANADALCRAGVCGRGPCKPGFYDFDGAKTFGCEARCSGGACTDGGGNTVRVDSLPPPESGLVGFVLSSGGSIGSAVQTSPAHTNQGVLGEPTPPTATGAGESKSASHRNVGGFTSGLEK